MKFTISTHELNSLVNKIQTVVPLKPTIPILSNLYIEASNDELILMATDLVVGIRCFTNAQIHEEGSTTLPAKKFAQLIRELTTARVEISSNANQVTTIIAGTSRFKLNGMSREEFPIISNLNDAYSFQMNQKQLKNILYDAAFAVSRDDSRYVLTGILMEISQGKIRLVGTDGKRLALTQSDVALDPSFANRSVLPLKSVEELLKTLGDEGEVKVSILSDKVAFESDQTLLLTKLISAEYPDYEQVIPKQTNVSVTLHREELISLLRQVSLFTVADSNQSSIRFNLSDGELKLLGNSMEVGEGAVAMPVNYHGEKIEVALNPNSLVDILRHCREETVLFSLIDAYNPVILTDGEQPAVMESTSPFFVIMPMRLTED
jgi:DNA polymerase-3 subunit beta